MTGGQVAPTAADDDISRAIEMSLQDSTTINIFELEPLNPDERQR